MEIDHVRDDTSDSISTSAHAADDVSSRDQHSSRWYWSVCIITVGLLHHGTDKLMYPEHVTQWYLEKDGKHSIS